MWRRAAQKLVQAGSLARATQLQQHRLLNVHEYQVTQPLLPGGSETLGQSVQMSACDQWLPVRPRAQQASLAAAVRRSRQTSTPMSPPFLLQGAQIMGSYGINVPAGIPVFKLDEVEPAARKLQDDHGEVGACCCSAVVRPVLNAFKAMPDSGQCSNDSKNAAAESFVVFAMRRGLLQL
jgi:hypothetical protein